jgi:PadR family transcriptional regulator PadR
MVQYLRNQGIHHSEVSHVQHDAQLLKGTVRLLVLRLLARESMYGYQMIQYLRRESQDYFTLGEGALYPLLHEMESAGLLKGKWVESEERPQRRRYYRLTEKGKRELARRRAAWKGFTRAMDLVLETTDARV